MSTKLDNKIHVSFEHVSSMEMPKIKHIDLNEEEEDKGKTDDKKDEWVMFEDTPKEKLY